jgi:ATP-dependent Lon protease
MGELIVAKPELPQDVIALIPMRNVVLFPHVLTAITVGRAKSIAALEHALDPKRPLGIILQKDPAVDEPGRDALFNVGTVVNVVRHLASPDGLRHAVCQGLSRFSIEEMIEDYPFLAARVRLIMEPDEVSTEAEALAMQLRERTVEILSLLPGVPAELAHALQATRAPSHLADIAASLLDTEVAEKQMLLETVSTEERLRKVLQILSRRIEVLRLSQEIGERTKEHLEDRERKFLLREQLKTIQKELGETEGDDEEIEKLDEAIAKAGMPEEIEVQARKELQRLKRMPSASSEYSMLQTYL